MVWLNDYNHTSLKIDWWCDFTRKPGEETRHRVVNQWTWLAVTAGSLALRQEQEIQQLSPGSVMLMPPQRAFLSTANASGVDGWLLGFAAIHTLGGLSSLHALRDLRPQQLSVESLIDGGKRLGDLDRQRRDWSEPWAVITGRPIFEVLLLDWLREHFASMPEAIHAGCPPDWLQRLRRSLVDRIGKSPLDVSSVARLAGCSPSHLAHLWKRHYGEGLHHHLKSMRLEIAARTLQNDPEAPIAAIAKSVGWRQLSHFSRDFRDRFGMSPRQWRTGNGSEKAVTSGLPGQRLGKPSTADAH